jgi:hypothetical protein
MKFVLDNQFDACSKFKILQFVVEMEVNGQNPFLPKLYLFNSTLMAALEKQLQDHPGFFDFSAFHRNKGLYHFISWWFACYH